MVHRPRIGPHQRERLFRGAVEPGEQIARLKDYRHRLGMLWPDDLIRLGRSERERLTALGRPPEAGEEADWLVG